METCPEFSDADWSRPQIRPLVDLTADECDGGASEVVPDASTEDF